MGLFVAVEGDVDVVGGLQRGGALGDQVAVGVDGDEEPGLAGVVDDVPDVVAHQGLAAPQADALAAGRGRLAQEAADVIGGHLRGPAGRELAVEAVAGAAVGEREHEVERYTPAQDAVGDRCGGHFGDVDDGNWHDPLQFGRSEGKAVSRS